MRDDRTPNHRPPQLTRDEKVARALRIRLALNANEARERATRCQQYIQLTNDELDEIDAIADRDFALTRSLWTTEERLAQAAFKRRRGRGEAT